MAEQHLSGAQITAIETKVKEAVVAALANLNLRKYAMQVALDCKSGEPLSTAQMVYDFLTEPVQEIVVRIEQ